MIKQLVVFLQKLIGTDTIDLIIFDRLLPHEEIVLIDGPAQTAFYFQRKWSVLLLLGSLAVAYFSTNLTLTALALGLGLAVLVSLLIGAVRLHYTRYVVTTNRIIYLTGVLKRTHQWIPWAKVTDLSMKQSLWDRVLNIGRVRIESANEDSQFREMKDLTKPETMMRVLVYMVSQRQGSVPLPRDIHAILGVPGPDGLTHLPLDDEAGGSGDDDDDGVGWGSEDDGDDGGGGGGGPDDHGGGSGGGDGGRGGNGGGGGDGDQTVLLDSPPRGGPSTSEGPLGPGTVTVPRPARGEESRPSRANPVQDVGEPRRRRRPDPPSGNPWSDDEPPDDQPPDPGSAALDD